MKLQDAISLLLPLVNLYSLIVLHMQNFHKQIAHNTNKQANPLGYIHIYSLYPEPIKTVDIKQQKGGPSSKRTCSKCSLTPSAHSQPSIHTHHSGARPTRQLPHIDTHSMHQKAQQYDKAPSKRTRSQYNSKCKTCTDHTAPHQTPSTPPSRHLPLYAPADPSTLTCNLQSNTPNQKRRLLQLITDLECPGPCTRPLDPALMAHAIWNYKINKARSLNASDAANTIYFYDLGVISIDDRTVFTI